jgi:hypothetical protein
MKLRASRPQLDIKEHLPDLDIPRPGRKHRRGRLLLAGLPVLGLLAFLTAARRNRRHAADSQTSLDGWQRQPLDPALASFPTSAGQSASSAKAPLDRESFPPGALDDAAGVMDNRPLQADQPAPSTPDFEALIGMEVKDFDGAGLGRVESVYFHESNGRPEWIGFSIGVFDTRQVLAPLEAAAIGEDIRLAYPKDLIESAATVPDEVLTHPEEAALYSHYHVRRMLATNQNESHPSDELLRKWFPAGAKG